MNEYVVTFWMVGEEGSTLASVVAAGADEKSAWLQVVEMYESGSCMLEFVKMEVLK